ncbi:MAG: type II toxin-antitoxin system prevent-host-death family antitoxin [Blastocatellia bacterium]|nr:type II toxin-antitoxin system prevent-host-death family antitoxin [Blastocatellia bacterium]
MKTANIAELKNHLSAYLAEVKRGGEVLVSDRNVPFAKIVPLNYTDDYEAEELELVAKGIMTLPEIDEPLPDSFWEEERPNVPLEKILEIIREDRDER